MSDPVRPQCICPCGSSVTRRKHHRPGIAPNANTTHVPTAGSSAAPTKPNHTPSRHSRARRKAQGGSSVMAVFSPCSWFFLSQQPSTRFQLDCVTTQHCIHCRHSVAGSRWFVTQQRVHVLQGVCIKACAPLIVPGTIGPHKMPAGFTTCDSDSSYSDG